MAEIDSRQPEASLLKSDHAIEPNSVWQDAYEHPMRTALEVGAAGAAIGAVVASRGKVERFLARDNVLLVEDTPYMGQALKATLEQQGKSVTWLTGVVRTEPFTGLTAEGSEVAVNLNKVGSALVDGQLAGSPLQGQDVVGILHDRNIFTMGISTEDDLNRLMIANGADLAARKPTVFTALVNNKLDLRIAARRPAEAQDRLDELSENFLKPESKPMREKADAVISGFLGL